jgi:hypothetical protein
MSNSPAPVVVTLAVPLAVARDRPKVAATRDRRRGPIATGGRDLRSDNGRLVSPSHALTDPEAQAAEWDLSDLVDGGGDAAVEAILDDAAARTHRFQPVPRDGALLVDGPRTSSCGRATSTRTPTASCCRSRSSRATTSSAPRLCRASWSSWPPAAPAHLGSWHASWISTSMTPASGPPGWTWSSLRCRRWRIWRKASSSDGLDQ